MKDLNIVVLAKRRMIMSSPRKEGALLEIFEQQLGESEEATHKANLQRNLNVGLSIKENAQGKKTVVLQTGPIDRVFDDVRAEALSAMLNIDDQVKRFEKIASEKKPEILEQEFKKFIIDLTKKAFTQVLTPEGGVRPELSLFLNKLSENSFGEKFKSLSKEDQARVKSSLIFSLAHAEIMAVMMGCLKNRKTMDEQQQITQIFATAAGHIKTSMDTIKKEEELKVKLLVFIENNIAFQAANESKTVLPGVSTITLNQEANALNKEYQLNLKTDKGRLGTSLQDQLLQFISKQHPDIIKEIANRYKEYYEKGKGINPLDVLYVLQKAGKEGGAAKEATVEFKAFVEAVKILKKAEESSVVADTIPKKT